MLGNNVADGALSTPGTNVVFRTCENGDDDTPCNTVVDIGDGRFSDCSSERFSILEGSSITVYDPDHPNYGSEGGQDGAVAEEEDSQPLSQCRKFENFSPDTLATCNTYLSPNQTYYLAGTWW
jgi:hypothetical protein